MTQATKAFIWTFPSCVFNVPACVLACKYHLLLNYTISGLNGWIDWFLSTTHICSHVRLTRRSGGNANNLFSFSADSSSSSTCFTPFHLRAWLPPGSFCCFWCIFIFLVSLNVFSNILLKYFCVCFPCFSLHLLCQILCFVSHSPQLVQDSQFLKEAFLPFIASLLATLASPWRWWFVFWSVVHILAWHYIIAVLSNL